jgi:protein TonB
MRLLIALIIIASPILSVAQTTETENVRPIPIVDFAEQDPTFPGGDKAMMEFIQSNIIYPDSSIVRDEQGTVYVQFVVNVDGSISDVAILRGVSPLLDAEAIRVISIMPKWNPASNAGKFVRVRYQLPIKFQIG